MHRSKNLGARKLDQKMREREISSKGRIIELDEIKKTEGTVIWWPKLIHYCGLKTVKEGSTISFYDKEVLKLVETKNDTNVFLEQFLMPYPTTFVWNTQVTVREQYQNWKITSLELFDGSWKEIRKFHYLSNQRSRLTYIERSLIKKSAKLLQLFSAGSQTGKSAIGVENKTLYWKAEIQSFSTTRQRT